MSEEEKKEGTDSPATTEEPKETKAENEDNKADEEAKAKAEEEAKQKAEEEERKRKEEEEAEKVLHKSCPAVLVFFPSYFTCYLSSHSFSLFWTALVFHKQCSILCQFCFLGSSAVGSSLWRC